MAGPGASPKVSLDTEAISRSCSADPIAEFVGDVDTNNLIPSLELLRKVQDFSVLDKDGKSRPFKSVYSGPNVPRRVLVIFVRHFFCGVGVLSLFCFPSISVHSCTNFPKIRIVKNISAR